MAAEALTILGHEVNPSPEVNPFALHLADQAAGLVDSALVGANRTNLIDLARGTMYGPAEDYSRQVLHSVLSDNGIKFGDVTAVRKKFEDRLDERSGEWEGLLDRDRNLPIHATRGAYDGWLRLIGDRLVASHPAVQMDIREVRNSDLGHAMRRSEMLSDLGELSRFGPAQFLPSPVHRASYVRRDLGATESAYRPTYGSPQMWQADLAYESAIRHSKALGLPNTTELLSMMQELHRDDALEPRDVLNSYKEISRSLSSEFAEKFPELPKV